MSRRASVSFVPKALPYRIDFSNTETGKMVKASKRAIVWKFGYPDGKHEENVTLKHSVTGGKKVVYENGKEIITVGMQSVITDFAHTWESNGHVLRVAVGKNHEYSFNVDGVAFEDFPSEFESRKMAADLAAKNKDAPVATVPKKVTVTVNKKVEPTSTKPTNSSSSFFDNGNDGFGNDGFGNNGFSDPFSSNTSSTSTVDPFSSSFGSTSSNTQDPFSSGFGNTTAPKAKSTNSKLFDNVIEEPSPSMSRQFTSPQDNNKSSFGNLQPPKEQQPTTIDFFADNTPPVQQKQPAANTSVFDFAGMTYEPPPPIQQKQPDIITRPPEQPVQKQPEPESFLNGLVNLDLSSNKNTRPNQRKSIYDGSTSSGPTVNSFNNTSSQQSINPFDDFNVTPTPQATQYNNVFGGNNTTAGGYNTAGGNTSGFNNMGNTGGGFNNMGGAPMGGYGMTPQSLYGGGASSNIGLMSNSGFMQTNTTPQNNAYGNAYGTAYGNTGGGQKQPNSLDSLNWKM